jgi:hypothetical protein
MIDSATIVWLNDVSSAVLTGVLDATLLGSLLVVTSVILFRLTRTVSASTRHFGLLLAIVSPVMLPLLASVLPQWHVLPSELVSVFAAEPQTLNVGWCGQSSTRRSSHIHCPKPVMSSRSAFVIRET